MADNQISIVSATYSFNAIVRNAPTFMVTNKHGPGTSGRLCRYNTSLNSLWICLMYSYVTFDRINLEFRSELIPKINQGVN